MVRIRNKNTSHSMQFSQVRLGTSSFYSLCGLFKMVDGLLRTEPAKRLDLDSKADVASYAIRELLKKEQLL